MLITVLAQQLPSVVCELKREATAPSWLNAMDNEGNRALLTYWSEMARNYSALRYATWGIFLPAHGALGFFVLTKGPKHLKSLMLSGLCAAGCFMGMIFFLTEWGVTNYIVEFHSLLKTHLGTNSGLQICEFWTKWTRWIKLVIPVIITCFWSQRSWKFWKKHKAEKEASQKVHSCALCSERNRGE